MHFCGELTVNYLRKGITKNAKDFASLARQTYKTEANTNVVNSRMGNLIQSRRI